MWEKFTTEGTLFRTRELTPEKDLRSAVNAEKPLMSAIILVQHQMCSHQKGLMTALNVKAYSRSSHRVQTREFTHWGEALWCIECEISFKAVTPAPLNVGESTQEQSLICGANGKAFVTKTHLRKDQIMHT